MDFPRGRGSSSKIVEFPGGGGSTARPSGTENPGGWGVKLENPSVGGMDIFWNHTIIIAFLVFSYLPVFIFCGFL